MSEDWKTYPYDYRYEVSTEGRVRHIGHNPRKPSVTPHGYHVIVISVPGKKHVGRYVHKMVLETFVGPAEEGMTASHLNGVRGDNRLENLLWESVKDNVARKEQHGTDYHGERNPSCKLTRNQVKEIRDSTDKIGEVAKKYGISVSQIGRIRRRENWNKGEEI